MHFQRKIKLSQDLRVETSPENRFSQLRHRTAGFGLSQRQLAAERRASALSRVESEEGELETLIDSWRAVPALPSREDLERNRRPGVLPFEPPPEAPDPAAAQAALAARLARTQSPAQAAPVVSFALGFAISTMTAISVAASLGAMGMLAWGLAVGGGVGLAGGAISTSLSARARARNTAAREKEARARLGQDWDPYWRERQLTHLRALHAWEEQRDEALRVWEDSERDRIARLERLLRGDPVAVEEEVAWSLQEIVCPFDASARVAAPDASVVYLLVDLPEIEDILPETKQKVLKDGTVKEIKRPKGERLAGYSRLVCGLAFLLGRTCFAACPTADLVHIAAYTQRRQRKTGEIDDDYVYDVALPRAVSASLDHGAMDPVAELQRLEGRIKRTSSGDLGKITPPPWATG